MIDSFDALSVDDVAEYGRVIAALPGKKYLTLQGKIVKESDTVVGPCDRCCMCDRIYRDGSCDSSDTGVGCRFGGKVLEYVSGVNDIDGSV